MDVKIRQWRLEDAEVLAKVMNNKKILDNLRDGIPYPYTKNDAEEYISFCLSAEKDSQYTWAITVDGRVVGSIGAFRKDNIHWRTAEIGYYIAEPYWGRGITTSAVRQVCSYLFENTDLIRIFAEPFAGNTASCRVLEKAGFVLEGVLRKNAVKNREIRDMKLYSLVRG
jgi:RimJ/RimL family protein N-acetyltransferase